jgi:cation diffusion facilitator CzcD-associated flavoprotein CzcO
LLTSAIQHCGQTALETTEIARITPTGVELTDGQTNELDVLVCATGFDTTFQYPFPVLGRSGQALSDRWAATAGGPEAYLSLAVDGFPNLFVCSGPHSAVTSGSLVTVAEHVVKYVVEAVRKMQRERLRSMEVRQEAMEDWGAYVRVSWRPNTVLLAAKVDVCCTNSRHSRRGISRGSVGLSNRRGYS